VIALAFSFGLLSSLHCLAMCGPLQAMVMGQWLRNGKRGNWLWYHTGRLGVYAFLGLLAALFGNALGIPQWQSEFTVMAGLVLLFGYFGLRALRADKKLYGLIQPLLLRLRPDQKAPRGVWWFVSSGMVNGLLPCGMVYAALLAPLSADHLLWGPGYMLVFGLGTVPLLLTFNLSSQQLLLRYGALFQRLIPVGIVVISALLILRGLQLDIPFLSPEFAPPGTSAEGCR